MRRITTSSCTAWSLVLIAATLLNPPTVLAQSAAPAPPTGPSATTGSGVIGSQTTPTSETGLAEIVVTAQKRTENLQQVPISVQVIGAQLLLDQNQNSLGALSEIVPSFKVTEGAFVDQLSIRGVSSGANASFDQSVATFIDDVYHGRSVASEATFLDLDRIEVLKGPQSTFFGNNAIAGALNVVSKKPGDTFEAYGRALYGMFGQYVAEGAVGGPLTDTLGVRVAVTRNGGAGWIDNINTGRHAPDENNVAGRVTVVYKPIDSFDATFKIESSDNSTSGSVGLPLQWFNCPPPAPLPPTFGTFSNCAQASSLSVPMGLDQNRNAGLAGQSAHLSTLDGVLTLNYRLARNTLTSVSGFSGYHSEDFVDSGQVPVETATTINPEKYHQFSQELRLASPAGGLFEYMVGAYYQTDEVNFSAETNVPFVNFIATVPGFTSLAPYLPIGAQQGFVQDEHIDSLFGSFSLHPTEALKLNVGLRGTWVDKTAAGQLSYGTGTAVYGGLVPTPPAQQALAGALFLGAPGNHEFSIDSHALMPSAGVQYQLLPEAMAYFTYNRGFLAGGINAQNGLGEPQDYLYDPEHVNAYELGVKSKWLDNRLLLNVDVFRSNYDDLQITQEIYHPAANFYSSEVGNAASSVSQGVELESQWTPVRNLLVKLNLTYLESYYVSYPSGPPTTLQAFCTTSYVLPACAAFPHPVPSYYDYADKPTAFAPRWSGSASTSYRFSLPGDYGLTTELSPYFTSRYWSTGGASGGSPSGSYDDVIPQVPAYVRLDARLTLNSPDGHWAADLIGKNLTDRVIIVNYFNVNLATKEQPRNVAVQVRYQW